MSEDDFDYIERFNKAVEIVRVLERQAIGEWLYSIVGGRHRTASFFARIFDDIETLKRGERPE